MGRTEDEIDEVGEFLHHFRQGAEDVLDALVRRKEPEGQEYMLALHGELILVEIGIDERHVDDAVGDEINLLAVNVVDLPEHLRATFAHHHQTGGKTTELLDDALLVGAGMLQNGVERGDDRDAEIAQEGQDVAATGAAVDAVLMLEADDIGVAEIDVIGRAAVGIEITFAEFETNFRRVVVALRQIIDRGDKALGLGILLGHGIAEIVGKRGDAALAGKIVAEEGDFFDFGLGTHAGKGRVVEDCQKLMR